MTSILLDAYGDAVLEAAKETWLPAKTFPRECPYALDKILKESRCP